MLLAVPSRCADDADDGRHPLELVTVRRSVYGMTSSSRASQGRSSFKKGRCSAQAIMDMDLNAPPTIRHNNFDFLRMFAAILVIYGHAYPLTGVAGPGYAANGVQTIGVKIFFAISGYLVAQSWIRDPSIYRFMFRRCVRIFPALIVIVILSAFVFGPFFTRLTLSEYFSHPATFDYLNNIFLYISYNLPGVFEKNIYPHAINGSLWSLPAEFSMYLLTPLFIGIASIFARGRVAFLVLTIAFAIASLYLLKIEPRQGQFVLYRLDLWSWLAVAPFFVIGMAYAVCRSERLFNIYVAFAVLFALSVFETSALVKEAALMLVLPYACLSFALGHAPALAVLTRRGDVSYGLFLYSFPVQQALVFIFGPAMGPWLNFFAGSAISFVLAFASWHLIEKRALQLKPSAAPRTLPDMLAGTRAASM